MATRAALPTCKLSNHIVDRADEFVGQLNHDLRNHLNAVELQAACLSEIVREPEAVMRSSDLREMTGDLCAHLQRLSGWLAGTQPTRCSIPRRNLSRICGPSWCSITGASARVEWQSSLAERT